MVAPFGTGVAQTDEKFEGLQGGYRVSGENGRKCATTECRMTAGLMLNLRA